MFHDLDVCVQPTAETLQALETLGYRTVAFTTILTDSNKQTPPKPLPSHSTLKLLQRATIDLSETSQLPLLSAPILRQFDLVAARPATEKLLQSALQADVDIIALPIDRRSPYRIRRAHAHVAAEKGTLFELSYAHALRETRRNFFANAAAAAGVVPKQLLLSSGATSVMELRGAHDIINLATLFDVPIESARRAVTNGAADVVKRGDIRARCHKGVVRVTVDEDKDMTD